MAQGRVTDFFAQKKRNASAHPSKRRKVEITTGELTSELDITNANPLRKGLECGDETANFPTENKKENAVFSPLQTRAARKEKATTGTKATPRARKTAEISKQKLIAAAFSDAVSKAAPAVKVVDSVTSSWDDHDSPTTPNKPTDCSSQKSRKRTRGLKTIVKEQPPLDVTPEKRKPVEAPKQSETKARKKLQLKSNPEKTEEIQENAPSVEEPTPAKTVPTAPEPTVSEDMKKTKQVKMSANVEAALKKCKAMKEKTKAKAAPKLTSEEVKAKLAKTGKLEELKEQLAQLKDTRTKVKAAEKSKVKPEGGKGAAPSLQKFDELKLEVPIETKKTVPAYERFHHLAESSAPTLGLPYKYRFLAEQFRGMDTVVSMLHNRNEVCTFSKLRSAVQEFTKRNFEKKHVGQIQTVYPTAYELRQEKGISTTQGFKDPGYQLTVTPNLDESAPITNSKRTHSMFKASHLLSRRERFHNGLIHIVKQHHKEFLSKLSRPLTIPDDKITRWHPKFPLDEVPDVEESPLPRPPDVQVLQTAKDVLENTRGRIMPQVQSALEQTIKEEEKKSNLSKPLPTSTPSSSTTSKPSTTPAPTKGFQSLLERVRAREAAKTAMEMTRNPKEEKRIVMMKRLPNIMRIVRSQFVTEKKPALPLDMVIQKVLDSYRSCIAPGDIEPHLQLCMEVVPEWMSQVQIKKGRYLKIDKNIELQALTDKVENLAKNGGTLKT